MCVEVYLIVWEKCSEFNKWKICHKAERYGPVNTTKGGTLKKQPEAL